MFGGFSGKDLDKKPIRPWLNIFLAVFIAAGFVYVIYTGNKH